MIRRMLACTVLLIPAVAPLGAQSRVRRVPQANPTGATGAYHEPAATMHGVLKRITGKAVVLIAEGDQSVEIIRTRKTKFLRNGKEINPSDIAAGSIVSIDVGKFPDLSPQAVNVMVDSPPIEGAAAPAPKLSDPSTMDQERPAGESPDPAAPSPPPARPPAPPSR